MHIGLAGLHRVYALVFPEHGTRQSHFAEVAMHPTGLWTVQQARHPATKSGLRTGSFRFLIRDRDAKNAESFDAVFEAEGIEILTTAPRAWDVRDTTSADEP